MRVRPLGADDESWKHDTLVRAWGSTTVARKGASSMRVRRIRFAAHRTHPPNDPSQART
jgi:hypothetical protein